MLVTIYECWWLNFDIGDILWMLAPDANVKRLGILVTKTAKTTTKKNKSVTNIDAMVFAQRAKVTKYSVLLQKVSGELT